MSMDISRLIGSRGSSGARFRLYLTMLSTTHSERTFNMIKEVMLPAMVFVQVQETACQLSVPLAMRHHVSRSAHPCLRKKTPTSRCFRRTMSASQVTHHYLLPTTI